MARRENAVSEIRAVLPEAITARVDWSDWQLVPGSFVYSDLRDRFSDLLFRTRLDRHPAFVYVLMEHQSRSDRLMAFRMLEYMVAIWRRHLAENRRDHDGAAAVTALPAIIPLVVHNTAAGTAWSAPTELSDLIDVDAATRDALGPCLPRLRFVLDDVAVLNPAALRERDLTSAARVLLVMQRIAPKNAALGRDMLDWLDDLRDLESGPDPVGDYLAVLTYAMAVGEAKEEDLASVFGRLGPRAKEAVVTTAETIEARGRVAVLLEQMTVKFGPLPAAVISRVQSGDATQVRAWATRILTAATLDELFT